MAGQENPISEMVDLVESQADTSRAIDLLADRISTSGRGKAQLETTFDILRRAFRKYILSSGGTPDRQICGFCKKTDEEVASLVVASDAAICDECTRLAADVIEGRATKGGHRGIFHTFSRLAKGTTSER